MKNCLIIFLILLSYFFYSTTTFSAEPRTTNMSKLMTQSNLEDEGNRLAEQGFYEKALLKYREVLKPENWVYEWETALARGKIESILKIQGKYKEASEALQWHLKMNPEKYEPERRELIALMEYEKTGNSKLVREHIKYRRDLYPNWMPPKSYADISGVSDILRLYDTIGDYDAGISFIDEILAFLKKNQEQFGEEPKLYDSIKNSQEATKCAELDKKAKRRNPNWRACNLIREHLLVREGFEKDKQNSGPECKGQKYCIGSATKAIIQSDYFPW